MTTDKVNLDLLHKLLRDDKEAIKKALELFVETTEEDMEILGAQVRNWRYLEASRIAHSLKSRFVYLGNEGLILDVKKLELMLKQSSVEVENKEVKPLFDSINKMVFFCLHEIKSEIRAFGN
jgi:HPt (histidine-containing phosphotransfer) domain-containing protein